MPIFRPWRHGSRAGYGSGVAGVDARRATPPDPRPPRWGRAGCCQLDPSHPTSSPARLAERVVTPHAPMTLGANHVSRGQTGGDPAASGDLRLSHRAPGRGGRRASIHSSPRADNTSVRARGVLSVGIPRFLNKSQHFTVHLFRPWRSGSARGSDGGPRRFTAVVPTPHAYSGQWPVKTKRARARSCASVVTPKRPSLNRAEKTSESLRFWDLNETAPQW